MVLYVVGVYLWCRTNPVNTFGNIASALCGDGRLVIRLLLFVVSREFPKLRDYGRGTKVSNASILFEVTEQKSHVSYLYMYCGVCVVGNVLSQQKCIKFTLSSSRCSIVSDAYEDVKT